jgi:hypothetical protein
MAALTAASDNGQVRRWPFRDPRGGVLTLVMAAALLGAPGCTEVTPTRTSTSTTTNGQGPVMSWSVVPLPTGVEPRTLTAMGGRLLVGGQGAGTRPQPHMLTVDSAGKATKVPLRPRSGYAFEARWQSVATDGTRVIAIGHANGGAHSNSRWTTWSGSTAGVTEVPQSFYAFGGYGAGELVDVVLTSAGKALVGTWNGAKAGLDGAIWLSSGSTWIRQDPAGTALESTPELLVGPRSAAADARGILVAGSALHLKAGSVAQRAALWRSATLSSGWRRLDLPQAGRSSEAVSASCDGDHCFIAGRVDGRLAMWDLSGDTATRLAGVPAIQVGDNQPLPVPLTIDGHLVQLAFAHRNVVTLVREGSAWSVSNGPDGAPISAALVGAHLYVTVMDGPGTRVTLWQTDARAWR